MLSSFLGSFTLGLLTPLTAACVIPLYPAFLSYLGSKFDDDDVDEHEYRLFGLLVVAGVVSFMLLIGILFTTVLQTSLTAVIEIVSPIAFSILAVFSLVLIGDLDYQQFLPEYSAPSFDNPYMDAFGFGFFFGGIVLPCNPGYIAVFLARSSLVQQPITSMTHFLLFGLGIGAPLAVFSFVSSPVRSSLIGFITDHQTGINRLSGVIILGISLYYLISVFGVIPGV